MSKMGTEPKNYNQTIKLPQTDFPMRGNLPQREPEILERWYADDAYNKILDKNRQNPKYILHDGPPYANGDIHTGHALNKILKDVVVKYKSMSGFFSPYVPGWDTHGLPIEQQVIKKYGDKRHEMGPVKYREACREFAYMYVNNQREQFKRLGVVGDWENPYLTCTNDFVAKQIEVFGDMAGKGLIYRGLKPVYWCAECETALAEAEVEYQEDKTDSIYVKFEVKDDKGKFEGFGTVYFVIWTTTTWTLPGNVAISINPNFEYVAVRVNGEVCVMAKELLGKVFADAGIEQYEILKEFKGRDLEYVTCKHPFIDRESLVIVGEHVTLEAGTGCVHTAPGHGVDDYIVCQNYPELEIVVPVNAKGVLNDLAGEFSGMYYKKSNAAIAEKLKATGNLFAIAEIIHQYPHCWRCHEPILFRATEQWFASVESFKDAAVEAINKVEWIPSWGKDRITSMVTDRSDWCISRQRMWGVPIPIFYCKDCGKELINSDTVKIVSDLFREKGSDIWYALEAADILPSGTKCGECGCADFTKEKDIMDVWFDSGSSHAAVCEQHKDLSFPPDLYLEGNDQYRGWFQSSLLTSVATRGVAPYSTVVTHGFINDSEGNKMSKSKGNTLSPLDIIKEFGADILRLWVVSADYKSDIRISKDLLKQVSEGYRKIRNTARYILGNISDFNPDTDAVAFDDMLELDKWAVIRLNRLVGKAIAAYDTFDFHVLYHAIHNFCVVDMSNFYLDIIKDRLYTELGSGKKRRSAQTAMYMILDALVRLLAPATTFTADEIWSFMPHSKDHDAANVMYNGMPKFNEKYVDTDLEAKWEKIGAVREDVLKALEEARAQKVIGQSLAADLVIYADGETFDLLKSMESELAAVFIVSRAALLNKSESASDAFKGEGVDALVTAALGEKCERCWMYADSVGSIAEHPTLCTRCADVVNAEA